MHQCAVCWESVSRLVCPGHGSPSIASSPVALGHQVFNSIHPMRLRTFYGGTGGPPVFLIQNHGRAARATNNFSSSMGQAPFCSLTLHLHFVNDPFFGRGAKTESADGGMPVIFEGVG